MSRKRVAVIGAGVTGLAAAYDLSRQGHKVVVFEKWPGLGGQGSTFQPNGHRLERYYHHWFRSDRDIVGLMGELGLGGHVRWLPSKMGFFAQGRIYDFVTPMDLLRFDALPIWDRVRLGVTSLYLQRLEDWRRLEGINAEAYMRRLVGGRAFETVWGPLLRGKFGTKAGQVNMAWLWGKLKVRRSLQGEGVTKEVLGYPDPSFEVLYEALEREITGRGGEIRIGQPVTRILAENGRARRLEIATGEAWRTSWEELEGERILDEAFDAILATVPNPIFLRIAPELSVEYRQAVESVDYQAAVVMLLETERPLSHIYWLNVADRDLPFLAVIEQTNFVPPQEYEGHRYVYISNYLARDHPLYPLGPEELLEAYLPGLRRINPRFDRSWVRRLWLFKEPHAQPIITLGYSRKLPPFRTPVEGLYFASQSMICPEDRGTNYACRMGRQVADLIDARLTGRGGSFERYRSPLAVEG